MKDPKFVVTGALGHIGSRLIRKLPELYPDAEIVMIDNLLTHRFASLFDLSRNGRYSFLQADAATGDLRAQIRDATAVVHLAAITDAASSVDNADAVEKNNFESTRNVARMCAENGTPLFYPSTTSVYGSQSDRIDENCPDSDLKPQSPYATTKLREEEFLADMAIKDDLRVAVCRLGTIHGASPGMRFHTAVNKFCWQAVLALPVTVWRTAYEQKRPYLYLGDAVRVICFFIDHGLWDGRIYNVVTSNHTVRDVVEAIQSRIASLKVEFVDERIMNQLSYEVINTRLTEKGFAPTGALQTGIDETLDLLRGINRSR